MINLKPCKCGCTRLRLLTDYEKMWHIECLICFRMGIRVNTPVGAVDFWNGDYVSFEGTTTKMIRRTNHDVEPESL